MLKRFETICVDLATAAIIALALMIFADVVALNLFDSAVPDAIILVRELMVIAIVMPLAAGTANRAHISVKVLSDRLPPRVSSWLIVFGSLFGLLALGPIVYAAAREFLHQWGNGSTFYGDFDLPRWPGRLAFLLGIALGWLRLSLMVIAAFRTVRAGGLLARA